MVYIIQSFKILLLERKVEKEWKYIKKGIIRNFIGKYMQLKLMVYITKFQDSIIRKKRVCENILKKILLEISLENICN